MRIICLCIIALMALPVAALPQIKVGVLKFGTLNWEMNVIKHHQLDKQNGFELVIVPLANKNATAVAIQGNAVDIVMTDLFWVLRQSANYHITPTHRLTGGIYALENKPKFEKLAIAGGQNDKNWLILQAYMQQTQQSLVSAKQFGAAPLLNRLALDQRVDAIINFWHFNAKLAAAGFKQVLSTQQMLAALGVNEDIPVLGWVFQRTFAKQQAGLLAAFLQASQQAKLRLVNDELEWQRLKPLINAANEAEFAALRQHYPLTLLTQFTPNQQRAAQDLVSLLEQQGQRILPADQVFDASVFWTP